MAASEKQRPSVEREEHVINHVNSVVDDEKQVQQDEERDWTGTARKTDPEEIRLVRKLDYRIMVSQSLSVLFANEGVGTNNYSLFSRLSASCTS